MSLSQIEQKRASAVHSSIPQRTNNGVVVVGAGRYVESMSFKKDVRDVVKQNVYSFQALFSSNYKPDAHVFYLELEDIKLILTQGVSRYGEWYIDGKRIPRIGGHTANLPEDSGIVDMEHPMPLLKERLDHIVAYTDGCQSQFGGRKSFGRVAEQISEKRSDVQVKSPLS